MELFLQQIVARRAEVGFRPVGKLVRLKYRIRVVSKKPSYSSSTWHRLKADFSFTRWLTIVDLLLTIRRAVGATNRITGDIALRRSQTAFRLEAPASLLPRNEWSGAALNSKIELPLISTRENQGNQSLLLLY